MERQIGHLTRLVDDLLDLSRITSGKIELRLGPLKLSEVVAQAAATSQPLVSQCGHVLEIELPEDEIVLEADSIRLTQVIANVLNNASRYTPQGGRIQLSASVVDASVVIRVRDTGRGITPEMLTRIFDIFVQEDRDTAGGGLGLGLTLVKRLVELHGGRVSATSEGPGKGSEFAITLPLVKKEPVIETSLDTSGVAPTSASLRVVVVDDNLDIRETVTALLRHWGHRVEHAGTGSAGLELILSSRPEVAFIDVGLPELDGYEVARRLRREIPREALRLVAMTGYGQESDRKRSLEAGFDQHLTKPVNGSKLEAALHRRREGDGELPRAEIPGDVVYGSDLGS
jgi:CheY-like chemotaxis protein